MAVHIGSSKRAAGALSSVNIEGIEADNEFNVVKRRGPVSKVFIVVPYARAFPDFPVFLAVYICIYKKQNKKKNENIITIALSACAIERSFGVMLQEHDAAALPDATQSE